jgi:hypothetical protein
LLCTHEREVVRAAKEELHQQGRASLRASHRGSWLPRPAGETEGRRCTGRGCALHRCCTRRTRKGRRREKSVEGGLPLHTLHVAAPADAEKRDSAGPCSASRHGPPSPRAVDRFWVTLPGNEQMTPRRRPNRSHRFPASYRFSARSRPRSPSARARSRLWLPSTSRRVPPQHALEAAAPGGESRQRGPRGRRRQGHRGGEEVTAVATCLRRRGCSSHLARREGSIWLR